MWLKMVSQTGVTRAIPTAIAGVSRGLERVGVAGDRTSALVSFFRSSTRLVLVSIAFAVFVDYAEAQWPLGKDLAVPEPRSESGPNVTGTGRYQIFVSPQAKGYTFMLDTETGRVWIMKKDHTSGEFSLQRVPVEQIDPGKGQAEKPEKAKASDTAK